MNQRLLRRVDAVRPHPSGVTCTVASLAGIHLPGDPGWLTGEDPAAYGVELTMPNLPELPRPDPTAARVVVQVDAVNRDTVRIRVAPTGHRIWSDDGSSLGIITQPATAEPEVEYHREDTVIRHGTWALTITHAPFGFRFTTADGRLLTRTAERQRQVAGLPIAPPVVVSGERHTLALELAPDEDIVGFGEQFGPLVKNGQAFDLSVADALGTATGRTYKPAPVWHSSAGWLGLLNTGCRVHVDVGHTFPSALQLAQDDALDLFLVCGDSPADRLTAYTELTGRAQVPPPWAFGYWMGRCRYHSATQMLQIADDLRAHHIPADVLHLDPDWLVTDRLNTDFHWNEDRFGPRATFVTDLAQRGFRLSLWELPYLDPASPRHHELRSAGHLVRTTGGELAEVAGTPSPDGRPRALLDFTNPAARSWWQEQHHQFLDDGVAVFKTDFGEGLPEDAALADGTPPQHAHNLYPLRYNEAVSQGIGAHTGRAPLVWGRSGWAGSHRAPGQWGGDAESSVAGMRATLRGGLSHALSMPGLWSHDIGGFFGPELTSELYIRWTQFGAMSPLMRAHGLRPREPWEFGDRALAIARSWIELRYSLLPYLWNQAHASLAAGWPMLRPLGFHHDDPISRTIDDAYLLGRDLLVAPIFNDAETPVDRQFWLPPGRWHPLLGGPPLAGGGLVTMTCPLEQMPVLVRDGAVLPRVEVSGARNTDDLIDRPWRFDRYGTAAHPEDFVGFHGEVVRAGSHPHRFDLTGRDPTRPGGMRAT